ncbi:hypothetical protein HG536_0E04820 [Torulaspora globosa]|uniref:Rap-GAP domain-containing protein n=1 Tax=Torulaspora globosa TaxID=48254 RepID=A0A7G3ZJ85_9SACH|nr:uncharacterized protein HG536_0E04820 [Torulaspora globosa]QLL33571.1 hypothetical protein HG536_0E04820 [Torulaspora globosa]
MPGICYASKGDPKGITLLSTILKSLKTSSNEETSAKSSLKALDSSSVEESHLLQLHKRLGDKSLDYDQRAQTAVEVRQVLKKFEKNCIPALWYSAHDLIRPEVPLGARKCAFELLAECINDCQDPAVREMFFRIAMTILARPSEDESEFLGPHIALILSCLRSLLNGMLPLKKDDAAFLRDLIEDIIDVSRRKASCPDANVVQELLLLTPILKDPIRHDSLVKLLDLLSSALKPPSSSDIGLSSSAVDFILYLTQEYGQLLRSDVLRRFTVILSRIADEPGTERNMEKLEYALHKIVQAPCNSVFLEELFAVDNTDCCELMNLYPLIFVDNLCRCSKNTEDPPSEKQINYMLDALHQLKKDKEILKVMTRLLRCCERTGFASSILRQGHIWPMVKSILTRGREDEIVRKFVESVLDIATRTNLSLFSTSLDDLIQSVCALQISDFDSRIIKLVKVRRADVGMFKTLDDVAKRTLSPNSSTISRLELYKLLIGLVKDAAFRPLTNTANQFAIALRTYNGSTNHEMEGEELLLFENFLYEYLQVLHVKDFRFLITEHIIPDVQAILAQAKRRKSIVNTLGSFGKSRRANEQNLQRADFLVRSCVKTFIWSATDSTGFKCILLFNVLCSIYSTAEKFSHSPASLAVARAMIRIRRSTEGHFYFTIPIDAVGISAAFRRLKEQNTYQGDPHKWTFPESVEYMDESLLGKPNENVGFTSHDKEQGTNINIGTWLSLAIGSIKAPTDWEIHSYLLAHLCSQLSEIPLLFGHFNLIEDFKIVICDHLTRATPLQIDLSEGVSHSDLHSAYVRNLSSVLAYHPFQQKKFADELVSALVVGLKSWEKTFIPILHILSVSCFEVPLSVQKCLTHLLPQIQMRITNPYAMPSVLEFLLALGNSPGVISNLTIDEVKRVFGIAFRLIENSVDLRIRSKLESLKNDSPELSLSQPHNQEYDIEVSPSTENFSIKESMVLFLQYQSFEVITSWFCSLNADRIKELLPFIVANLRKLEKVECLKYDALAQIDFVLRFPFMRHTYWGMAKEEGQGAKRWVGESTMISIGVSAGGALVKVWKPTCTFSFEYRPRVDLCGATYDVFGFNEDAEMASYEELCPDTVLSQLSYSLETGEASQQHLIQVPDDTSFDRSIHMLDHLPNKEFLKIGIIYIDKDQDSEVQVLSNTKGSHQYHWFLNQMGRFIKLSEKPKLFYAGGLEDVTDGEFALLWNGEITHMAFHTTTLMPNSTDLSSKKRHVGNNFVNIFYNESGLPHFNFNIIKSQFTFISIVITPLTAAAKDEIAEHYKIKLYRRTGTPGLLSCAHFKILTKNNLARYVRHVAQIANALAEKTHQRHPPDACSAWGKRYKHLQMIRERAVKLNSAENEV